MIKLYDKNLKYLGIVSHKNLQIIEELGCGYKTARFSVPYSFGFLQEEQKIEVDNYLFSIKEINMDKNDYYTCYCKPYYGQLQGKKIDSLTGYNMTLRDCLNTIVEDTDWAVEVMEYIAGSFTLNLQHKTALEALNYINNLFNTEYFIDTLNKVIRVWNKRGTFKEQFFFNTSNLQECKVQSNTYDLITRLIPLGKNQTTIGLVNNNCLWLDDFSYTDEIIIGYYINSQVENADDLLSLAKVKLKEVAQPHISYKIKATALKNELEVGDSIRVINEIKGLDTVLRVNKKVKGLETFYEVGDSRVTFDDIYKSFTTGQEAVNEGILRSISQITKGY